MQRFVVVLTLLLLSPAVGAQPKPQHPANAKDPLRPRVRRSPVKLLESPDKSASRPADKATKKAREKPASARTTKGTPVPAVVPAAPPQPELSEEHKKQIAAAKLRITARSGDKTRRAKELRERRRLRLRKILTSSVLPTKLASELKTHAIRMAKLERIESMATTNGDIDVLTRVERALAREKVRHSGWLARFEREEAKR